MRRGVGAMVAGVLWLLLLGAPVGAYDAGGDYQGPTAREQDQVDDLLHKYNLQPAFRKLGRGLSNVTFGWAEIPLNIHRHKSRADTGGSFFTGLTLGLFKGLVRTGVGIYEAVTFVLPYPEHYAPILPTLDYFKKTHRRRALPLE